MIFSIHIPKTAGTSFGRALEERYGKRLALFYGARDPKTHPALRIARTELSERIPALEAEGIEVVHGHYMIRHVQAAASAPGARVWTWLRDPVERTLSHYSFYRDRPNDKALADQVRFGGMELDAFSRAAQIRNLQSRYLGGLPLSGFEFVGVTERFELGLALLFGEAAPALKRRYNVTDVKVAADERARTALAAVNARDMGLYAEGLRLFVDRLAGAAAVAAPERPQAGGTGLVRRLIRKVA